MAPTAKSAPPETEHRNLSQLQEQLSQWYHPAEATVMDSSITVETDMFEHGEVKPHFINPCCFGEDFAVWLKNQLSSLTDSGFVFSDPIQEDYGWGFCVSRGEDRFWVAISYAGDGPQEPPAQWVVSVNHDRGLNLMKRVLNKPDAQVLTDLRDRVWKTLGANEAIKTIDPCKQTEQPAGG